MVKYQVRFTVDPVGYFMPQLTATLNSITREFIEIAGYDFMLVHSQDFKVSKKGLVTAGNVFGFVSRFISEKPAKVAQILRRAFQINGFRAQSYKITFYRCVGKFAEFEPLQFSPHTEIDFDSSSFEDYPKDEVLPF